MSDTRQPSKPNAAAKPAARGGLRLVKDETTTPPTDKPRRKSLLVGFMTEYADAIDRDIKAILDL